MAVQHVIAEPELVDVDRGQRCALFDGFADALEAILIIFAAATWRRPEIEAELVTAIDAADDARDFDRPHPQIALRELAGPLRILHKAP